MDKLSIAVLIRKLKNFLKNDCYRYQAYLFLNRPEHLMGILYQILIIILVAFCIIFTALQHDYWNQWLPTIDLTLTIIFSLEFLIQIWSSTCLPRYRAVHGFIRILFNPICLLDLFIILSTLITLLTTHPEVSIISDALRGFRILHFFEHKYHLWRLISSVIWNGRFQLLLCVYFAFLLLISISLLLHLIEKNQNEDFGSWGRSIWFTLITLTTVGYGDTVPISTYGRIVTAIAIVIGTCVFALPSGIIGAGLALKVEKEETIRSKLQENHAASVIQTAWQVYLWKKELNCSFSKAPMFCVNSFSSSIMFIKRESLDHRPKLINRVAILFIGWLKFRISCRRFKRSTDLLSTNNFHELYSRISLEQMEKFAILERIARDNQTIVDQMLSLIQQQQQEFSRLTRIREYLEKFKKPCSKMKPKCRPNRRFKLKSIASL